MPRDTNAASRFDTALVQSVRSLQDEIRPQYTSLSFPVNGRSSSSRTLLAYGNPCWPQIPRLAGPQTQGMTPRWIAPTTKSSGGRSKANGQLTRKRPSARSHESLRRPSQSGYRSLGRHLRCSQVVVTGGAKCLTVTELKGRTPFSEGVLYPLALELLRVE